MISYKNYFELIVRDERCDMRLDRFPYAQEAPMNKPKIFHLAVRLGGEVEVVLPIGLAVRRLEEEIQRVSVAPRKVRGGVLFELYVRNRAHQIKKFQ